MGETVKEFRDELRQLREEMFVNADAADIKLVASYIDRLVLSLDKLSEALEMFETEIDTMSEAEEPKATAAKKPAMKMAKKSKAAKKKRR
jgi:hypothetical protein